MIESEPQLELGLDVEPEAELPARLRRLGLAPNVPVILTRNRAVLVSWHSSRGLRLHAGYAWAPDQVLSAIVSFIGRRLSRTQRLAARRSFLSFPVERHAPTRARRSSSPAPAEHAPLIDRLERLHQILNERHFSGALRVVPIRLSERMQTRLGEYEASGGSRSAAITISARHIRIDGWPAATETLLHEMVHQWQEENGLPMDHGTGFRRKAREVGITPAAVVKAVRADCR